MSTDYTSPILTMVNNNTQLLQQLLNINNTIESYTKSNSIDIAVLTLLADEAEFINKKIIDNVATINNLAYKSSKPASFFESVQAAFNKKVQYLSDTLPATATSNTDISGNIIFLNEGMFYSWTTDKAIKLRVRLTDFDNNVLVEQVYNFDATLPSNIPGAVEINGDFHTSKTFVIDAFTLPLVTGQHNLVFDVLDDTYTFLESFKKYVTII